MEIQPVSSVDDCLLNLLEYYQHQNDLIAAQREEIQRLKEEVAMLELQYNKFPKTLFGYIKYRMNQNRLGL